MGNIGPLEIGIVLIVALLVFGPKKLPELGNSLGKGIREFKGSISGEDDDRAARTVAIGEVAGSTAPSSNERQSA